MHKLNPNRQQAFFPRPARARGCERTESDVPPNPPRAQGLLTAAKAAAAPGLIRLTILRPTGLWGGQDRDLFPIVSQAIPPPPRPASFMR